MRRLMGAAVVGLVVGLWLTPVRATDLTTLLTQFLTNLQAGSLMIGPNTAVLASATAPTIASGFGTSPSVVASNGTGAFTVNVGTGGTATSGVLTMPAATTGWACFVIDQTTNTVTRETATTGTSVTLTAAAAWTASDVLQGSCWGY